MTPPIKSYRDITDKMQNLSREDEALIKRAYDFAWKSHFGQARKSGEPYFNHLFETAMILRDLEMGPKAISAGLLHDVIEDTEVTEEELEKEFGLEILFLVSGVTKLGAIKYRGTKRHVESLRKLFIATSRDVRVLIIKLADRLHNMRTLEYVPEAKRERIALETLEVYAPIAHRLGIGQLKGELEDLSFKHLYPEEYDKTLELAETQYEKAKGELINIHKKLVKRLADEGIYALRTDYRRKHLWSLYSKLKRHNMDIEEVFDLMALRIVVNTVSDCYRVLGIVHALWRPLPGRIKDYIAFPKPNGYQSIHTTIFTGEGSLAEIQIRTQAMHHNAEYGVASHVQYKKGKSPSLGLSWFQKLLSEDLLVKKKPSLTELNLSSYKEEVPRWICEMAEAQSVLAESQEFFSGFKSDFLENRIFVFTPKGDVIDLPQGSSPVDFAYHVHSDVGDKMSGAKINGKLSSLNTTLKNGDIVEVTTSSKAHPSAKWLEYAKTILAKRKIRSYLGQDEPTP